MKLNKHVRAFILIVIMLMMVVAMAACTSVDNNQTETPAVDKNDAVNSVGGYSICTETMSCTLVVDGQYKYSCFESKTNNRKVEFYVGPTEMIILDFNNGVNKYYTETFKATSQTYVNPLSGLYAELGQLSFDCVGEEMMDCGNCNVYEAVQTVHQSQTTKVKYNVYSISMDWIDGKNYEYRYYDYADGASLVSAEAPDEINPRITKDTNWLIDLDNLCVYNTETNQSVDFVVTNISVGEGLSPNGSTDDVVEMHQTIRVYVNQDDGNAEYLQYNKDGSNTEITIINQPNIVKPAIADNALLMNDDEKQMVMMLIYMLESLI